MADIIQRNMSAGEIAPALRSRTDMVSYQNGLALCENFFVRAQGGVYSRPGLKFIDEIADSTKQARVIPFSFNTTQTYILVFEDLKMYVIYNGAFVMVAGVRYSITTPYLETELSRVKFSQNADTLTMTHPNHPVQRITRTAHDVWNIVTPSYTAPVAPVAPILSTTGSGASTFNKDYFYVVTSIDANGVESLPSTEASVLATPALSTTAGIRLTITAVVGAASYRVYKDPSVGSGVYGWIGDTVNLTFDDFNLAPITSDGPPSDRQPISSAGDYPSTSTYYQQREVFANTTNEPQVVLTTQTANYESFRVTNPTRSDDAVTFTIAAKQVNEIRHLVSLDSLILLTSGGEWKVTEGQDMVLTPSSAGVKIQSANGSSHVVPAIINDNVVFVQEKGSRVRDLGYQFSSDKFTGSDLSIMAEHLFEDYTIIEMAYADEPYGILWCLRSDGVLLGLTYQREHKVFAWHHHTTDGVIESIATISEDGRDALYMVVKRNLNGSDVRLVERMEKRDTSSAAASFCVDSGLSYSGAPATVISGLTHLEGEAVTVLADGNEVTGLTVVAGSITLQRAASIVHVGLQYTPVIETLDVDTVSQSSIKGRRVSVAQVVLEVEKSRGGWVGPKLNKGATGAMTEIKPRFEDDGYDTLPLRTFKEEVVIQPAWGKSGGVRIEQRSPLPMAILSVIPSTDVGG